MKARGGRLGPPRPDRGEPRLWLTEGQGIATPAEAAAALAALDEDQAATDTQHDEQETRP